MEDNKEQRKIRSSSKNTPASSYRSREEAISSHAHCRRGDQKNRYAKQNRRARGRQFVLKLEIQRG